MSKSHENPLAAREQELKAIIDKSREAFMLTLSDLQNEANPKTQVGYLKEDLIHKVQEVQVSALNTVDEARDGNLEAVKKVAVAAGAVVATIALMVLKRKLKKRRNQ